MKDQLGGAPPTIGGLRRQGVIAFRVRCARPCKRVGRVELTALRLPDDAIVQDVPRIRRLRCEACDRYVATVEPIWPTPPAEPIGVRDAASASWLVVLKDADGREAFSSPQWSRLHAATLAQREIEQGGEILRIEGPEGTIGGDELAAFFTEAARR